MIFPNKNLYRCKWSKCDKGVYRGYHTPIEWELHQSYVKVDLPPPIYPVNFEKVFVESNTQSQRQSESQIENLYYGHNIQYTNSSRKWQYAAVGTMVAVWVIVIWSVIKIL